MTQRGGGSGASQGYAGRLVNRHAAQLLAAIRNGSLTRMWAPEAHQQREDDLVADAGPKKLGAAVVDERAILQAQTATHQDH